MFDVPPAKIELWYACPILPTEPSVLFLSSFVEV